MRQGCPLSGTLFVVAVEFLAQRIRRSKEIKGIPIDEHNEVKLSQYADDTTVLFFLMSSHCQGYLIYYRFLKGVLV